jgi:hypothetical protein
MTIEAGDHPRARRGTYAQPREHPLDTQLCGSLIVVMSRFHYTYVT